MATGFSSLNFSKLNGLIPAIVQDAASGMVLMVGFMNREALDRTLAEKQVVFWSRSKKRLWKKGETSGNFLNIVDILADCDNDALLVRATPVGPTCHTGDTTCFHGQQEPATSVIAQLAAAIRERKASMPEGSYTAKLFKEGNPRIGQKVGEEGVELAIAAQYNDLGRCTEEAADLIYHLLVLLESKGIAFDKVGAELKKRMK